MKEAHLDGGAMRSYPPDHVERRLFVPITWREAEALRTLAERERRDPRHQAAYFIAEALKGAGALTDAPTTGSREPEAAAR